MLWCVTIDNSSQVKFAASVRDLYKTGTLLLLIAFGVVGFSAVAMWVVSTTGDGGTGEDFLLHTLRIITVNGALVVPGFLVMSYSGYRFGKHLGEPGSVRVAITTNLIGLALVLAASAAVVLYSRFALAFVPEGTLETSGPVLAGVVFITAILGAVYAAVVSLTQILWFVAINRKATPAALETLGAQPRRSLVPYALVAIFTVAVSAVSYPLLFPAPTPAEAQDGHAFDDIAWLPFDMSDDGQNALPTNAEFGIVSSLGDYSWTPLDVTQTTGSFSNEAGCTITYAVTRGAGDYVLDDDKGASEAQLRDFVAGESGDFSSDDFRFATSTFALDDGDTSWWDAAVFESDTRYVALRAFGDAETSVVLDGSCPAESDYSGLDQDIWTNLVLVGTN